MLLMVVEFSVELKLVDCCVRVRAFFNHKLKELNKFLGYERVEVARLKPFYLLRI